MMGDIAVEGEKSNQNQKIKSGRQATKNPLYPRHPPYPFPPIWVRRSRTQYPPKNPHPKNHPFFVFLPEKYCT
ncbi:MAG: hypothetical protein LCH81_00410 [Bacteroidetes bacterium]|nr:hypothetical protein [Bacteroidota bacterium]